MPSVSLSFPLVPELQTGHLNHGEKTAGSSRRQLINMLRQTKSLEEYLSYAAQPQYEMWPENNPNKGPFIQTKAHFIGLLNQLITHETESQKESLPKALTSKVNAHNTTYRQLAFTPSDSFKQCIRYCLLPHAEALYPSMFIALEEKWQHVLHLTALDVMMEQAQHIEQLTRHLEAEDIALEDNQNYHSVELAEDAANALLAVDFHLSPRGTYPCANLIARCASADEKKASPVCYQLFENAGQITPFNNDLAPDHDDYNDNYQDILTGLGIKTDSLTATHDIEGAHYPRPRAFFAALRQIMSTQSTTLNSPAIVAGITFVPTADRAILIGAFLDYTLISATEDAKAKGTPSSQLTSAEKQDELRLKSFSSVLNQLRDLTSNDDDYNSDEEDQESDNDNMETNSDSASNHSDESGYGPEEHKTAFIVEAIKKITGANQFINQKVVYELVKDELTLKRLGKTYPGEDPYQAFISQIPVKWNGRTLNRIFKRVKDIQQQVNLLCACFAKGKAAKEQLRTEETHLQNLLRKPLLGQFRLLQHSKNKQTGAKEPSALGLDALWLSGKGNLMGQIALMVTAALRWDPLAMINDNRGHTRLFTLADFPKDQQTCVTITQQAHDYFTRYQRKPSRHQVFMYNMERLQQANLEAADAPEATTADDINTVKRALEQAIDKHTNHEPLLKLRDAINQAEKTHADQMSLQMVLRLVAEHYYAANITQPESTAATQFLQDLCFGTLFQYFGIHKAEQDVNEITDDNRSQFSNWSAGTEQSGFSTSSTASRLWGKQLATRTRTGEHPLNGKNPAKKAGAFTLTAAVLGQHNALQKRHNAPLRGRPNKDDDTCSISSATSYRSNSSARPHNSPGIDNKRKSREISMEGGVLTRTPSTQFTTRKKQKTPDSADSVKIQMTGMGNNRK